MHVQWPRIVCVVERGWAEAVFVGEKNTVADNSADKFKRTGNKSQPVGAKNDQHVNTRSFVVRCDRMWPSTQ